MIRQIYRTYLYLATILVMVSTFAHAEFLFVITSPFTIYLI